MPGDEYTDLYYDLYGAPFPDDPPPPPPPDLARYNERYSDFYGGPYDNDFVTHITDDQILDGQIPVRADDFRFELIDGQGRDAGKFPVSLDATPTIRFDTSRTVFRTLTNVEVLRSDLQQIDTEHERVRVTMLLQNGSEFPLGIFMFGQDNQAPSDFGNTLTPELFDEAFLLDQPLDMTVSVPTGGTIKGLIDRLLAPFPKLVVRVDADDIGSASPLLFLAGSSRYDALKQAAAMLGCFAPYLDRNDMLRFKLPRDAGDTAVDHTYLRGDLTAGITGRIFDESIQLSNDSYRAPNRYLVVGDSLTAPVVGTYDLPDSAPNSAVNRDGRVVSTSRTVQGIDASTALHLAYMDAITDQTAYGKVSFAAAADPRHDGFDTLNVLGVRYLETAWELDLVSGGDHRHEGVTLWV